MKIENKTTYRTNDLHELFARGLKEEGVRQVGYVIRVEYARSGFPSGYAYYNSKTMCVRIPSPKMIADCYAECAEQDKRTEPDSQAVARVFVHELGHCLGLHHKEMANVWSLEVPWSVGFHIRVAEPKVKPKMDIKIVRFKLAQKLLAKHESKLKREQKFVKKYRQKVRYYKRTMAKAACNTKETK